MPDNDFQELVNIIGNNVKHMPPKLFTPAVLNASITDGNNHGCTVALALLGANGNTSLFANNNALGSQITTQTLNTLMQRDGHVGLSVALSLAIRPDGLKLLTANDNKLGLQINHEALNAMVQNDAWSGLSVAFVLTMYPAGLKLLTANNNQLGLQINREALNAIMQDDESAGLSVAFLLAKSSEGLKLLTANDNALGLQITAETLNTLVEYGQDESEDESEDDEHGEDDHGRKYEGHSVALYLASSREGIELLTANNNALGALINAQTLNTVIASGPNAGLSVAYMLTQYTEGYALLKANNAALYTQITDATLNSGPGAASGRSVRINLNNLRMLPLYTAHHETLRARPVGFGKKPPIIHLLPREVLDRTVAMLDGRRRPADSVPSPR